MRHRVEIFLAAAILAVLAWTAWVLVTGPLAPLVDSRYETFYAMMTIMVVCISIVSGVVVGAWDATQKTPHHHPHLTLRSMSHRH